MIYLVIWTHFIADFILQSDKMAQGKSSSNKWLTMHILVYTLPLCLFGWKYALINGAAHWCVDYCTSRASSYMYKNNRIHDFFVVVGFDQAVHLSTLIYTMRYIDEGIISWIIQSVA